MSGGMLCGVKDFETGKVPSNSISAANRNLKIENILDYSMNQGPRCNKTSKKEAENLVSGLL